MENYWDRDVHHRVYPIDAPPEASQREREWFRTRLKREARRARGRCPYCGKCPEPGRVRCERCLALKRKEDARGRERARTERDAQRRAAEPRRCAKCSGSDLGRRGLRDGRPYFKCRICGRYSFGDGPPPPPPEYPCPYCGSRCVKSGHGDVQPLRPQGAQKFVCTVCKRQNRNLWPGVPSAKDGPFPHIVRFGLDYPARDALLIYCQEKMVGISAAIRDILIHAAQAPVSRITVGRARVPGGGSGSATHSHTISAPAPPLPAIPPGGVRLPDARPAAFEKLAHMRVGNRLNPTVLVAFRVAVRLNDAALASLLEIMRRRNLNHQDAARAVIAEAAGSTAPG